MKSLWSDAEAAQYSGPLGPRVYTSRLLGRDKSLVLHGGGNTSVKLREKNLFGEEEDILYVKGSGWDLATIEEPGFAPVRLAHLRKLAKLEVLSDPQMMNELTTQVTRAGAPAPSVETSSIMRSYDSRASLPNEKMPCESSTMPMVFLPAWRGNSRAQYAARSKPAMMYGMTTTRSP